MSAYNWIKFNNVCPACNESSELKSQTHVASDFGGKNARFCHKEYEIGDKMDWWPNQHPDYKDWKEGNLIKAENTTDNGTVECCYTECLNCNAELYAIVQFEELIISHVKEVGLESKYPNAYYTK